MGITNIIRGYLKSEQEKENNIEEIKIFDSLVARKVELAESYKKKWNIYSKTNFYKLYKDGKKVSDTLYRIPFLQQTEKEYCLILKCKEDIYSDDITKIAKDKFHIAEFNCIIDKNGNEKVVADSFKSVYLHGAIYSIDNNYYAVETKEKICKAYKSIKTKNFLFLKNSGLDIPKDKEGVFKVDLKTGEYEIIN